MKISLCMIVKDAESTLPECLESILPHVDELCVVDTGSTDGSREVITEIAQRMSVPLLMETWIDPDRHPEHHWISDFAAARNRSLDLATGDIITWIDSDTVLEGGEAFAAAIKQSFIEGRADLMTLAYEYEFDDFGNCIRNVVPPPAVFRRGYGRFIWPVHEDVKCDRPANLLVATKKEEAGFYWRHLKPRGDYRAASERNCWIMEQYMAKGGEMNNRLWSNYATALAGCERHEEALEAYEQGYQLEGSSTEHYAMRLRHASVLRAMQRPVEAAEQYLKALLIYPNAKTPRVYLAETCREQGDFEGALIWCQKADEAASDATEGVSSDPMKEEYGPLWVRAQCYLALGMLMEAYAAYGQLAEKFPGEDLVEKPLKSLREQIRAQQAYEALMCVADRCNPAQRSELMKLAPEETWTMPEVAKSRRLDRCGKRTIAIYCGGANKPWHARDLEDGIGGSEEAVILLGRELVKAGWCVEVYAFPYSDAYGQDEYGVRWYPYYAWEDEPVDVFVSWRSTKHISLASQASQRWIWLHDVVQPEWYTPELAEHLDGIFCLSDFHARPLPEWVRDKIVLTKNGLDPEFFREGENAAHKFIYPSSPDRGLEQLLERFPDIRKAIPDAELHIYYGFTHNYLASAPRVPDLRRMKVAIEKMVEEQKDAGVVWHGMVGQGELAQAFADCGFWLYPTSWPETSCITGMKAQAMGCIPVTSRFKASGVPETVRYDLGPEARDGEIRRDPEWMDEWVQSVIKAAGEDHAELRQEMMAWAREVYSWHAIAEQWTEEFLSRRSPEQQNRAGQAPQLLVP